MKVTADLANTAIVFINKSLSHSLNQFVHCPLSIVSLSKCFFTIVQNAGKCDWDRTGDLC